MSWKWQLGLADPEAQVRARIQASGLRVHTWTAKAMVRRKATAITSRLKGCSDKTSQASIVDSVPFTPSAWALLLKTQSGLKLHSPSGEASDPPFRPGAGVSMKE